MRCSRKNTIVQSTVAGSGIANDNIADILKIDDLLPKLLILSWFSGNSKKRLLQRLRCFTTQHEQANEF